LLQKNGERIGDILLKLSTFKQENTKNIGFQEKKPFL
jgi:hypothetical protein